MAPMIIYFFLNGNTILLSFIIESYEKFHVANLFYNLGFP